MLTTICQWFKNSFKIVLSINWLYLDTFFRKEKTFFFSHFASQVNVSSCKNCTGTQDTKYWGRTSVFFATWARLQCIVGRSTEVISGQSSPWQPHPLPSWTWQLQNRTSVETFSRHVGRNLLWVYANLSTAVSVQIILDVRGEQYQNMIFYECWECNSNRIWTCCGHYAGKKWHWLQDSLNFWVEDVFEEDVEHEGVSEMVVCFQLHVKLAFLTTSPRDFSYRHFM